MSLGWVPFSATTLGAGMERGPTDGHSTLLLSPRESPRNTSGASVVLVGFHHPFMWQEGGGLTA